MADESVKAEPLNEEINFDSDAPQGTAYVKWDVKGGRDRTHHPNLATNYSLEGSPNIQGIEIRSSVNVKVLCWGNSSPGGNPDIVIDGPTNGKHKINARRLGSYRVEIR
ncbi:hypothetical protein XA68_10994 [Ophiocordyceps unilateralis]|uniref:Uncharacterized protein n=1 Tax=Ophiocordyceps unilateralis TaxID=268505 RepID=A0A2A9PPG9_OPHUN|nr:hypothetical protein XA68_10994 [Ophiocordyceps unilateralis]